MTRTPSDYSVECFRRAEDYINDVLSGRINVGRYERAAVERYARDVERDDLEVRPEKAARFFGFCSALRHYKGRQFSGTQFMLEGWEAFIALAIFGVVWRATGLRRYQIALVLLARKNGKTMFAAAVGLYLLSFDDEPGAEVYAAATKRDQAKLVHNDAKAMVRKSPPLAKRLDVMRNVIANLEDGSKFEPVGADADTLDGLNPSGVLIDELHAHPNSKMWNVMLTGVGARQQPLIFAITTAGIDRDGVCYDQRDYAIKVLEGVLQDDQYFAFIAELDPDDDWTDEKNWRKANPNLGVSVQLDEMRAKAARARVIPSEQNDFRTKRLNQWVAQKQRWLTAELWDALPFETRDLNSRLCYAGLDLSATRDLTAFALVFPPDETLPVWVSRQWFWLPEDTIDEVVRERRIPYDRWVAEGWVTATPGNIVDYDIVRADIIAISEQFSIREIGYDPWNSSQIVVQLQNDGLEMVKMRQGFATLHAPTKELEKLIVGKRLDPGRSPVLRWMASNVTLARDPAGNMKPSRENDRLKIDGIVAMIMGIGRAIAIEDEEGSMYRTEKPLRLGADS